MVRTMNGLLIVFFIALLAGCGGGSTGQLSAAAPAEDGLVTVAGGVPSPANLPVPARSLSITGPGWYTIDPNDASMRIAESGNTAAGGDLRLDSTSATAFAIFGVSGFDGDCFPTSVRITVDYLSGSYYVAYCDYTADDWMYVGPFTGTSTSQIPDIDEYTSPTAFVSDEGWFYVMVIAHDGSEFSPAEVMVGVHGGDDAPGPPSFTEEFAGMLHGGAEGVTVFWQHSLDYRAPDFAGYTVERAPATGGDYTTLVDELVTGTAYLDTTTELEQLYYYRVAARDTSGNQSAWLTLGARTDDVFDTDPVAGLRLPQGDLHGAQDVTFDMSGSFDPMGAGITNYELYLGHHAPSYSGGDDVVSLHIQPGCYRVTCTVTSAAGTTSTVGHLKVYPEWEAEPELIAGPDELYPRTTQYRTAVNPVTGRPVFFWYDNFAFGLMALEEDTVFAHLPVERTGMVTLGEPLVADDAILLPLVCDEAGGLARYEDGELSYIFSPGYSATGESVVAFVDSLGLPSLICVQEGFFDYDLMTMNGIGLGATLVNDVGADCVVDAVHDPDTDSLYVMYSSAGVTNCRTYVGWVATGLELAYDKHATGIDLEVNPATGRLVCAYFFADVIYYNEQNVDGTWPHPERVVAAGTDRDSFDLVATEDGVFIAFAQTGGILKVRRYNEGVWDGFAAAEYDGGLTSGNGISLAPRDDGGFVLADIADDNTSHIWFIESDGTADDEDFLPLTELLGLDITAATAPDYLHVTWQEAAGTVHYTRDHATGAWAEEVALPGYTRPALMAGVYGDVYLAYVEGGTAYLDQWDAGWVNIDDAPVSENSRPIVTAQPYREYLYWYVNDDDVLPAQLHASRIHEGTSSAGDSDIAISPLWAGTAFVEEFYDELFAAAGTISITNASVGTYKTWPGSVSEYVRASAASWSVSMLVRGKVLDGSAYNHELTDYNLPAYWVAWGAGGAPARVARNLDGSRTVTSLPGGDYTLPAQADIDRRRTVTAALGHGTTAVGLVASVDGRETWFEWDDFGAWEDLDLPPDLEWMSLPELVVDWTGRWHLVYRHLITGEVYCWSTTE